MTVRILTGDCRDVLATLPAESVHCVVTSPPYWGLRDYGVAGQIGMEPSYQDFVAEMVAVFREVRRVLRADGTLWLNLGDTYAGGGNGGSGSFEHHRANWRQVPRRSGQRNSVNGLKPKDLCGIPWRVAFALQADGWWLRQDIIWSKPNPMPESVTDRCTKAHEYVFLLSKSERYYYDADAIKETSNSFGRQNTSGIQSPKTIALKEAGFHGEGGDLGLNYERETRNRRSVWEVATQPFSESHFATFPPALIEPCILAGCPKGGTVLDPFGGAGTTGLVADRLQRNAILIELNPFYAKMAERRIYNDAPLFAGAAE
jgi:DNA modification methylase